MQLSRSGLPTLNRALPSPSAIVPRVSVTMFPLRVNHIDNGPYTACLLPKIDVNAMRPFHQGAMKTIIAANVSTMRPLKKASGNNENDNTRDNLRQAMAQNPYLNVMIQSGYFDGATTYFNAKYTMWQVDPSGRMKDRFSFKGYRSGHMMYLRREDLKNANDDIREFIKRTIATDRSAKY